MTIIVLLLVLFVAGFIIAGFTSHFSNRLILDKRRELEYVVADLECRQHAAQQSLVDIEKTLELELAAKNSSMRALLDKQQAELQLKIESDLEQLQQQKQEEFEEEYNTKLRDLRKRLTFQVAAASPRIQEFISQQIKQTNDPALEDIEAFLDQVFEDVTADL